MGVNSKWGYNSIKCIKATVVLASTEIVLEILTFYLGNSRVHCPTKCETETVSSPSPHLEQALVLDLRMVFVKPPITLTITLKLSITITKTLTLSSREP